MVLLGSESTRLDLSRVERLLTRVLPSQAVPSGVGVTALPVPVDAEVQELPSGETLNVYDQLCLEKLQVCIVVLLFFFELLK